MQSVHSAGRPPEMVEAERACATVQKIISSSVYLQQRAGQGRGPPSVGAAARAGWRGEVGKDAPKAANSTADGHYRSKQGTKQPLLCCSLDSQVHLLAPQQVAQPAEEDLAAEGARQRGALDPQVGSPAGDWANVGGRAIVRQAIA